MLGLHGLGGPQCWHSCSVSRLCLCSFIGSTADANPVNQVIQILTNLEAKIKADTESSDLTHHREGDERWSFGDAVENGRQRHRCTRCDGAQTVTSSLLGSNASVTPAKFPASGIHVTSFQSNMECDVSAARICAPMLHCQAARRVPGGV